MEISVNLFIQNDEMWCKLCRKYYFLLEIQSLKTGAERQMIRPRKSIEKVYLCREPVDFRKAINGLSMIVEETLCLAPFSEQLFVLPIKNTIKLKYLRGIKRVLFYG